MDKKKIALIHILKRELNLSDDEYRNILRKACAVESAKDLDEYKFRKLMNFFVRSRHWHVNKLGLTIKQKLYIQDLARRLNWTNNHLDNFMHKYYHRANIDELNKREAAKVIAALKNIKQHH